MRLIFLFCLFLSSISSATEFVKEDIENALKLAIYRSDENKINYFLSKYQKDTKFDPIVILYAKAKLAFIHEDYNQAISLYRKILAQNPNLNSIRMELAIALFADKQDIAARYQLDKIRAVPNLPNEAYQKIDRYIKAIDERGDWKLDISFSYLRTNNVENVSDKREIEDTGFIKNNNMLPQNAEGISYNIYLSKDINIINSHYLYFTNYLWGKLYWDNHQFDDVQNKTYLGYAYKKPHFTIKIAPYYTRRWYGEHRYHGGKGVSISYQAWLSNNFQNYLEFDYEKRNYVYNYVLNGNVKTISDTFIWLRNPKQIFYFGIDFSFENTAEKQFSSILKNFRVGWLQEYYYGISTKFSFTFADKKFKREAVLGGFIPLGKKRHDKIYLFNTQIWKRDWTLLSLTPKIEFNWKNQVSNLSSLYSYQDKSVTLIFEKTF